MREITRVNRIEQVFCPLHSAAYSYLNMGDITYGLKLLTDANYQVN